MTDFKKKKYKSKSQKKNKSKAGGGRSHSPNTRWLRERTTNCEFIDNMLKGRDRIVLLKTFGSPGSGGVVYDSLFTSRGNPYADLESHLKTLVKGTRASMYRVNTSNSLSRRYETSLSPDELFRQRRKQQLKEKKILMTLGKQISRTSRREGTSLPLIVKIIPESMQYNNYDISKDVFKIMSDGEIKLAPNMLPPSIVELNTLRLLQELISNNYTDNICRNIFSFSVKNCLSELSYLRELRTMGNDMYSGENDDILSVIIAEKCDGSIEDFLGKISGNRRGPIDTLDDDWYSIIFQIIWTLAVIQDKYKIMHNDLHKGNWLYVNRSDVVSYNYNLKGQNGKFTINRRYPIKLWDFDWVYSPPVTEGGVELINSKCFDPAIEGTVLKRIKGRDGYSYINYDERHDIFRIFSSIYNSKNISDNIRKLIDVLLNIPKALTTNLLSDRDTLNVDERYALADSGTTEYDIYRRLNSPKKMLERIILARRGDGLIYDYHNYLTSSGSNVSKRLEYRFN